VTLSSPPDIWFTDLHPLFNDANHQLCHSRLEYGDVERPLLATIDVAACQKVNHVAYFNGAAKHWPANCGVFTVVYIALDSYRLVKSD
jgi:hypothetical protein